MDLLSLDLKDALGMAGAVMESGLTLFAATVGLDGRPQVRPAGYMFEQNKALYFLTAKKQPLLCGTEQDPIYSGVC